MADADIIEYLIVRVESLLTSLGWGTRDPNGSPLIILHELFCGSSPLDLHASRREQVTTSP